MVKDTPPTLSVCVLAEVQLFVVGRALHDTQLQIHVGVVCSELWPNMCSVAARLQVQVKSLQGVVEEQKKKVLLRNEDVLALTKENAEIQMLLKAERDASRAATGEPETARKSNTLRELGPIFWPFFLRRSARAPTIKAVRGTVASKGIFNN